MQSRSTPCYTQRIFHVNTHTQITAGCFHVARLFREKRDDRTLVAAMAVLALKRYLNQSIIRNNGFLKTTFHRDCHPAAMMSRFWHICQVRTPRKRRRVRAVYERAFERVFTRRELYDVCSTKIIH